MGWVKLGQPVRESNFIEESNSRQNNRIFLNYNKTGTDGYTTDLSLQNRTTINNPQFIREEGVQNSHQNKHDVGFNYLRTNSYSDNLNVNGTFNHSTDNGISSRFSEVRDTAARLQSTNDIRTVQKRRSNNETLNLEFAKSDTENPLKRFSIRVNGRHGNSLSERDAATVFKSFTDASKSTSNTRRYVTNNESLNIGANMDYTGFKRLLLGRYNLFGIDLNFSQRVNYSRTTDHSQVSDYDSSSKLYETNASLTNQNKRELFEYTPSLSFSKFIYKWSDIYYRYVTFRFAVLNDFKTDRNFSSFAKRNLERSFQFLRYEGNLSYQYQKRDKFQYYATAMYTKNFEYPTMDQLYTIVDDINAFDIRIGNPFLTNTTRHSINLNGSFNTQNPKSVYSVNGSINGGYNHSVNPVVDSTINQASGKRISYFINAGKSNNLNLSYSFNISRRFKKNNLQLMYNGSIGRSEMPNYIDGISNISETGNFSNQATLQFSLRSLLVITAGKTWQQFKTEQSARNLNSFRNTNSITKLGITLNYPANFSLSSTVDHINNSNLNKPTILWNAFASYRFMKQQGELKFSAMDLLKQYQNIINSVNTFGTTTRITNGLQQYFLLTFSYYPRKFGKTEIKRKTD